MEQSTFNPGLNNSALVAGIYRLQLRSAVMETQHAGGHIISCCFFGTMVWRALKLGTFVCKVCLSLKERLQKKKTWKCNPHNICDGEGVNHLFFCVFTDVKKGLGLFRCWFGCQNCIIQLLLRAHGHKWRLEGRLETSTIRFSFLFTLTVKYNTDLTTAETISPILLTQCYSKDEIHLRVQIPNCPTSGNKAQLLYCLKLPVSVCHTVKSPKRCWKGPNSAYGEGQTKTKATDTDGQRCVRAHTSSLGASSPRGLKGSYQQFFLHTSVASIW